jgi:hypothetical protein
VYEECYEALCMVVEEFAADETDIEGVVSALLFMLGRLSDDILGHIDPPFALRKWLDSHGLSLVPTSRPPAPIPWEEEQGQPKEQEPEEDAFQVNLGDRVRFQTKAQGPRMQSRLGEGTVVAIRQDSTDVVVTVQTSPVERVHIIPTQGDVIEVINPPS